MCKKFFFSFVLFVGIFFFFWRDRVCCRAEAWIRITLMRIRIRLIILMRIRILRIQILFDAYSTFYPDADPDPDSDPDPDPNFQIKAQTLEKVLK
jgi:hypothetical protein